MTRVPQIVEKSRCQKADMKQVWYWVLTVLDWPVNLTDTRPFLLGVCELLHISACKERNCNHSAYNVRHHGTKFSYSCNHGPRICVPLAMTTASSALGVQWTSFINIHYELLNVTWYIICNATKWGIFLFSSVKTNAGIKS